MSLFSCLHENERYAARDDEVRMERRGKSSPDGWEQPIAVNSIRSNAVEGHTGRPGRPGEAARARQQWRVEIDGCLKRQNPAYRLTAFEKNRRPFRGGGSIYASTLISGAGAGWAEAEAYCRTAASTAV